MTKENPIEFDNTDLLIELYELVSKIIMDLIDNHEIDENKVINHFNEKNPENIKFDIKEDLKTIYEICLEIYEE